MTHAIRIFLAKRAYNRAYTARRAYDAGKDWNILVSLALHNREAHAANKLARIIDPSAILTAF